MLSIALFFFPDSIIQIENMLKNSVFKTHQIRLEIKTVIEKFRNTLHARLSRLKCVSYSSINGH